MSEVIFSSSYDDRNPPTNIFTPNKNDYFGEGKIETIYRMSNPFLRLLIFTFKMWQLGEID